MSEVTVKNDLFYTTDGTTPLECRVIPFEENRFYLCGPRRTGSSIFYPILCVTISDGLANCDGMRNVVITRFPASDTLLFDNREHSIFNSPCCNHSSDISLRVRFGERLEQGSRERVAIRRCMKQLVRNWSSIVEKLGHERYQFVVPLKIDVPDTSLVPPVLSQYFLIL